MNEADRSSTIEAFGMIPCASNEALTITHDIHGNIASTKCLQCNTVQIPNSFSSDYIKNMGIEENAISIFSALIKFPAFLESQRSRVLAMIALRRFSIHSKNVEFMDLELSPLGQWCVGSIKSSVRELRIAAG